MNLQNQEILQLLLKQNFINADDVKATNEWLSSNPDSNINEYLLNQNLITKDLFGQAIAEYYNLPYLDLNSLTPPETQVTRLEEEYARKYSMIIFDQKEKELFVATSNPEMLTEINQLFKEYQTKLKTKIYFALPEDIEQNLHHYLQPLAERIKTILASDDIHADDLLNQIFTDALVFKSSDVHMEPYPGDVHIRLRIDGQLRHVATLPSNIYENLLNYVKIESNLRIDEHYAAQDGALRMKISGHEVDLRISIVPILNGEKVVIRILSAYVAQLSFAELGIGKGVSDLIHKAALKPFGMILNTGPTGSGKTTTLYSLVHSLHRPEVNITTIEDPVEYKIAGINQIQVNEKTGLTFERGLRAIVRQDPNIILVGEIRDKDTAEIAVNAALTGHLLLSTFHANDAATAIPRLLEMGIESFLLASTLNVIISQRLVRKLCEKCRYSYETTLKELTATNPGIEKYIKDKKVTLYTAKGCDDCGGSGFKGRTGLFEAIYITPEIQELILTNPSSNEIWKLARTQGALTFIEDGIYKLLTGTTSLTELLRVAPLL